MRAPTSNVCVCVFRVSKYLCVCVLQKPLKIFKMADHMFFNAKRIEELTNKEIKFFVKWRHHHDPPSNKGITGVGGREKN